MKTIKKIAGTLACLAVLSLAVAGCTNTNNRNEMIKDSTDLKLDTMNPEPADTNFSEEEIDPNQTDIEGGQSSSFDRDRNTGADTAKTVRPQAPKP